MAEAENPDKVRLIGKAEYKGRTYYVNWRGITRTNKDMMHLYSLDGNIHFFADAALCKWLKSYEPKEYRGRKEYTTLGSMQRFIERQRNPNTKRGQCTECGSYGPSGEACSDCGGEGSYT